MTGQALNGEVNKLRLKVEEVVNDYKGAAGAAANPQVDQFADSARTAAESLTSEPKRTLTSTIDRMLDLLGNQSQLLTAVSLDYQTVRKELESVNQIAQQKIEVEINAKQQSEQEKLAELTKHEEDRRGQLKRLDDLQSQNQQYLTEINELKNQVEQLKDEWQKRYGDLLTQFRDVREQLELNENVLERADGKVTYVDYNRNEVRTTLNRRMGAREQLVFTIFDRDAAGLPTDKPKATIELIKVGETESVGKIVKQMPQLRAGSHWRPGLFPGVWRASANLRADRQDRREPRWRGRPRGPQAHDSVGRRRGELRPSSARCGFGNGQAHPSDVVVCDRQPADDPVRCRAELRSHRLGNRRVPEEADGGDQGGQA